MITLGSIRQADPTKYDEIWVICRAVNKLTNFIESNPNVYHVPELSPQQDLLYHYLNLKNNGDWNSDTFRTEYVPQFVQSLKNYEAIAKLNELTAKSNDKNILLVCFCSDETMCHRSIIGGILMHMDANIQCNPDYAEYHL